MVLSIIFVTAIPGNSWCEDPKGYPSSSKGISELTLPDVTIAPFASVPASKEPLLKPKLKDSATTLDKAMNYKEVMNVLGIELSEGQKQFLERNKFLLIPASATSAVRWDPPDPCAKPWDEMLIMYDAIGGSVYDVKRSPENARLVTPDIVLHAFHKFFENSLKSLEKHDLAEMLRTFVQNIQATALRYKDQSSGKLADHYEVIAAQFTVPLMLMENARWQDTRHVSDSDEPTSDDTDNFANARKLLGRFSKKFPAETLKIIEQELALIYEAKAQAESPLFARYTSNGSLQTDYTQYTPRSHYTATSITRAYFRTMMYLGRNSYFLEKGPGITDALLVMHLMAGDRAGGGPIIAEWQRIMEITGFYAGKSDDICYPEWRDFVAKTLGKDSFNPEDALNPETLKKISDRFNVLRSPRILSEVGIGPDTAQQTKEQRLEGVKAFRIFGQRFTLDAWILSRLTGGLEKSDVRLPSMPSALFMSAVFGDKAAKESCAQYLKSYEPAFSERDLSGFFGHLNAVAIDIKKVRDPEWFGSLNSASLNVIRNLTALFGEGYPLYMQSRQFPVKQLESFLGSYTELKHDTLLYEKQPEAECGGPGPEGEPPPVPKGFVEPNLPFWYALQRLVQFASEGFKEHGLLEREREEYGQLSRFQKQVDFYTALAEKELLGIEITEAEYEALRTYSLDYMAEPLDAAEPFTDRKDRRSGLVADIYTDKMTGQILYEGTAEPYIMLALVGNENSPRLTMGVAFNHYEFTGPLGARLTDADWQAKAYDNPNTLPPKSFWYKELVVK
ncbi:MAG: DUF3160 domain-containing protein [Pseudomonadota bacterium]